MFTTSTFSTRAYASELKYDTSEKSCSFLLNIATNSSFGTIGTEAIALNTLRVFYASDAVSTSTSGVGVISLFITCWMYFSVSHQRLHLRLQTLQVVVRLCIAVGNLGLLLNRLSSTHVLDGSQARDNLVLHGGRGGAQRQLGELDGEDLRVQHDGCDGICIDVNALSLEAHVHSEEDLPSIPIPTPTGLNTWHKDL